MVGRKLALPALISCWLTAASPARAQLAGFAACFGGVPDTATDNTGRIGWLRIDDRYLYWGGRRMDLASRAVSPSNGDREAVSDGRELFDVTGVNELIAIDLATGKVRTVVDGRNRIEDFMGLSMRALDGSYVYFGMGEGPQRSRKDTGFFRVARDGSQPPEMIGPMPRTPMPFLIADGFVYWSARAGLMRRKLDPGAPEETIAAASDSSRPRPPLRVVAGRIYYVDGKSIWSRPVGGGGPATEEAALGSDPVQDVVVVPPCLYWATARSIRRARLQGDPKVSQVIADERSYAGNIVSDGHFLYWADVRAGRILRAAPSARTSVPPAPAPVATPARAQSTRPLRPEAIAIGEGWGCARVSVRDGTNPQIWHCWQAARSPIVARKIPWLIGNWLQTSPHRACAVAGAETRCWSWPELQRGQRPAEVPTRQTISSPHAAVSDTITCTSVPRGGDATRGWRCTGDERTGPKAVESAAVMEASTAQIVLGRWHGCMTARGGDTFCWGRDDGGQLGFPATDRCGPAGHEVACATELHPLPFKPPGALAAGDMYTCAMSQGPMQCWGASRDGLFGTAEACPPELRKAWPTGTGTVAAPAATCSAAPVNVPGFKHAGYEASVGPRGICAIVQGHVRCAGAIPTPAINVSRPQVSPGDDASACGLSGDTVVCWGERYSPPDDPSKPVEIALDTSAPAGLPVMDFAAPAAAPWNDSCDVRFGCERDVAALPGCAAHKTGRPWSELIADAKKLQGTMVEVRGRLFVGRRSRRGITVTAAGPVETPPDTCSPGQCCNHEIRPIVIADDPAGVDEGVRAGELDCRGDDSRLCCNGPAYGQPVIATGKLTPSYGSWTIAPAELCAPRR
jgi:hypothetical protein